MADVATLKAPNPWKPIADPIDQAHLGKLLEELGEAVSAAARCYIQGIEECEPVSGKPNREWLEDELADVLANVELVIKHFDLNEDRMMIRLYKKKEHLIEWHSML